MSHLLYHISVSVYLLLVSVLHLFLSFIVSIALQMLLIFALSEEKSEASEQEVELAW